MEKNSETASVRLQSHEKELLRHHVRKLQIAHGNSVHVTESSWIRSVLLDALEEQAKQDLPCKQIA